MNDRCDDHDGRGGGANCDSLVVWSPRYAAWLCGEHFLRRYLAEQRAAEEAGRV